MVPHTVAGSDGFRLSDIAASSPLVRVSRASPPPASLGETGADLWRSITREYQITGSGGLEMLRQACAERAVASEW